MEENKVHNRHLMLFFIEKAKMPHKQKQNMRWDGAMDKRTVQKRFSRFKAGDFNLEDQELPAPSLMKITSKRWSRIIHAIRELAET